MKSLIAATFGVTFPQRWQGGALEWVKTSSSCKCWQAEGGLKLSRKSLEWWAGKQKTGVLSGDLDHGFWLELSVGVQAEVFSCVWMRLLSLLMGKIILGQFRGSDWRQSLFSFAEWVLGRPVSFIGTAINLLLESFLLKNTVYKQLSAPKRREMYSLLIE